VACGEALLAPPVATLRVACHPERSAFCGAEGSRLDDSPLVRPRPGPVLEFFAMESAISVVIGGLITVLTTIAVEYLRRPKLSLAIEDPPLDAPSPDGKTMRRNLRLSLRNEPLPYGAGWMQRAAAIQCRGEITFHHLDGQNKFGRTMPVRWVRSPEPIANQIIDPKGQVQFYIRDFARAATEPRVDVPTGEEELLDIVVRFDHEPDCYGWNNDSYAYNWRNPNWKLEKGRYLVKVVITSSGQNCVGLFRLVNDVENLADFRLIPPLPNDQAGGS
jgi:hypothetical protein